MFGFSKKVKDRLTGAATRISGRTDVLEAVCAACALVACADGEIEDQEIKATTNSVTNNALLSNAFTKQQIAQTIDAMLNRAQTGRAGRMGLMKEISQISSDHDIAETVLLTALDIADADGELEPAEQKVLEKIASELGLDLKIYADA